MLAVPLEFSCAEPTCAITLLEPYAVVFINRIKPGLKGVPDDVAVAVRVTGVPAATVATFAPPLVMASVVIVVAPAARADAAKTSAAASGRTAVRQSLASR